jgi:hypothetical protein
VSYTVQISGHKDSVKDIVGVLEAAASLAQQQDAQGTFSFSSILPQGGTLTMYAGAQDDAVEVARREVADYNAKADADDRVEWTGG